MARYVKKEFSLTSASWTAPAGVTSINLSIMDLNNKLMGSGAPHSAGLRADGSLVSVGAGSTGQLADGTIVNKSSPVPAIGGHSFINIAIGTSFGVGLKVDGSAWAWGFNNVGQLGDGTVLSKSVPTAVIGSHSFIKIATGTSHVIACKADGTVWTWGSNGLGELGDGTSGSVNIKSSPVQAVGGHSFVQITGGRNSTAALKADGTLWTWGQNSFGQLGDGTTANKSVPTQTIGTNSFIGMAMGYDNLLAMKSNGDVFACGWGSTSGTGLPSFISSLTPVTGGHKFVQISSGGTGLTSNVALKIDGTAWGWGSNSDGMLGDGTISSPNSPVSAIGGNSFINIANGTLSTISCKLDGSMWTWGGNAGGQLGDNTSGAGTQKSSPVQAVGGFLFLSKPRIITERVMTVTPGNTYTFNTFLTQIDNQVILNTANGNNLTIVVEYYV